MCERLTNLTSFYESWNILVMACGRLIRRGRDVFGEYTFDFFIGCWNRPLVMQTPDCAEYYICIYTTACVVLKMRAQNITNAEKYFRTYYRYRTDNVDECAIYLVFPLAPHEVGNNCSQAPMTCLVHNGGVLIWVNLFLDTKAICHKHLEF